MLPHECTNTLLNPTLYHRLCELGYRVEVAKRGESPVFRPEYELRPLGEALRVTSRTRQLIDYAGETYRINCPFCVQVNSANPDTKQRLWIGHMWGVFSPQTGTKNWGQAVCFHNNCLGTDSVANLNFSGWDNVCALRRRVYDDMLFSQRQGMTVLPGKQPEPRPVATDYPQFSIPLEQLPFDHPANVYLRARRFDPVTISRQYGVRYCVQPDPEHPPAVGRLIIPVFMDGKMVMWQARYCGDIDFKQLLVPKYYNQRGTSKSSCLYGFDAARGARFVTIVEGITNVWRLGSGAVALLGKSMSYPQFCMLTDNWPIFVIALDAGTYLECEGMYRRLNAKGGKVVRVTLPDGHDPDTLGEDAFWQLVLQAANEQGVAI